MMARDSHELSRIPLPTDIDANRGHKAVSPAFSGNLPDLKNLLKHLQLDDILLFGLIILLATDDDCDNFLLVLLVIIFLSGFDNQLFPFF